MNDWPQKGETLVRGTDYDALAARLAEAERLIRRAYGCVSTLRRMCVGPDRDSAASYEEWQREANAWLGTSVRPV